SAGGFAGVHLVDEAVVAIAPLGGESRLRAGAGEERGHDRGVGVVLVHGREAEYGFHGVHHVYRRVEAAVDKRTLGRSGRVLADDESDGAVGVDVVGAVLGVVFDDEDGSVIPVGAVGNGFDDAA